MKLLRILFKIFVTAMIVGGWLVALAATIIGIFTHGEVWGPMAVVFIGYFGVQILYMLNVFAHTQPQKATNPLMQRTQ